MENNSEDLFELFKDKVVSKTKKFNFKKVDKIQGKTAPDDIVTSPFFNKSSVKSDIVRKDSKGKLDSTNDDVEKQLDKLFNGDFEDDIFKNDKLPQKTLQPSKRIGLSSSFDGKSENSKQGLNSKSNITVAPVFLFKEKVTSSRSCSNINSSKETVSNINNLKQSTTKNTAKFNFKKKPSAATFYNKDTQNIENGKTHNALFSLLNNSKKTDLIDNDILSKSRFGNCETSNKNLINNVHSKEFKQEPLFLNHTQEVSSPGGNTSIKHNDECTSPIIKPKKFTFKKKVSTSSSSSFSQLLTKKSPEKNSPRIIKTPIKATDSPIVISSDETFCKNMSNVESSKVADVKKNLFSDTKLDDTVLFVSQSLETTEADYMTDEQFQKFLSSTNDSLNEFDKTVSSEAHEFQDELNLNDIDWNEQFDQEKVDNVTNEAGDIDWSDNVFNEEPTPTHFVGARTDDSTEFRKNFHFSEVMTEVLHDKFGLRSFRPHQREVINASLNRHDCFVLMPTGGGKSLCYQLPAILSEGVTIVISPLRALISDQVDKLNGLDIAAAHLCANVTEEETKQVLSKLHMREPGIKLLYLTPEKIVASQKIKDTLDSLYQREKLARFVIDEAHCLSQWGHDFRPDYKKLSILRKQFQNVPIICLTATATKQVETDVINILKLNNVKRFIRSFNRPNIKYEVLPKTGRIAVKEISNLIRSKFFKKSGIIYCLARNDCQKLAEDLNSMGIKTKPYHAGMPDKVRENIQREWMQDQFFVIVATIAFGMGIDKPDVRFVIHNSIPKSVEAFYQESGRAGRDGEISYSYLFYSYSDVGRLQNIMRMDKNCNKKTFDGHMENLKQMVSFAENVVDCRRHLQLLYLGENFDRRICIQNKETTCDNCENFQNYNLVDITKQAKELATLVEDLSIKGHVTLSHVADVYKGAKVKKVLQKEHDRHKYYGAGSTMERVQITRILKDLILKGVLADHHYYTGEFPVVYIKLGPKFHTVNSPNAKFTLPISKDNKVKNYPKLVEQDEAGPSRSPVVPNKRVSKPAVSKFTVAKMKVQCHEELLEECRRLALEKNVTLSSIMNLSAIKSMSVALPKTREEFLKIQHVTVANYNKFGEHFLKITTKYREQLDTAMQAEESKPSQMSKSSSFDDDDDFRSSPSKKRKYTGGYRRGAKRYKRSNGARTKKSYRKTKTSSPKKTSAKAWRGKTKGGLGLMPVHVK